MNVVIPINQKKMTTLFVVPLKQAVNFVSRFVSDAIDVLAHFLVRTVHFITRIVVTFWAILVFGSALAMLMYILF